MNRYFLHRLSFVAIFAMGAMVSLAQTSVPVTVNGLTIADIKQGLPNQPPFLPNATEIVPINQNPNVVTVNDLANGNPKGKVTSWLEYGDGGFTTRPNSIRTYRTGSIDPFLIAIPLYDTSKGKDGTIARYMKAGARQVEGGRQANPNANDSPYITQGKSIKITPNNYNIVPREPLALAITYKIPVTEISVTAAAPQYYALIYYNNDNRTTFQPLTNSGSMALRYNATAGDNIPTIPDVRLFEGQSFVTKSIDGLPTQPDGYTGFLAIKLDSRAGIEKNFFLTLKAMAPSKSLGIGDVTSIMVRLVALGNSQPISSDTLSNMRVADAFDPNHITQLPKCILLPKGNAPLKYNIAFQNLGKGPADSVKIVFRRPQGLDGASFSIQSAKYAGKIIALDGSDPQVSFRHVYNPTNNIDTFWFVPKGKQLDTTGRSLHLLRGTEEIPNALSNPLSMGEVNFTINTTTAVADEIKADADIYFHSFFATPTNRWEELVVTNKAISVYKEKECECNNTCIGGCYIILGLCWWWWALILLALMLLLWLLFRRRR